MIINKQVDKISFTFNLNVEFSGNMTFNHKNPLTKQKIDCIIKSASEYTDSTNMIEPIRFIYW